MIPSSIFSGEVKLEDGKMVLSKEQVRELLEYIDGDYKVFTLPSCKELKDD
jgi:hypothetical protein